MSAFMLFIYVGKSMNANSAVEQVNALYFVCVLRTTLTEEPNDRMPWGTYWRLFNSTLSRNVSKARYL